jgi:predicted acyl esterase
MTIGKAFKLCRHSGASAEAKAKADEPGIHNHDREYGFRARLLRRRPGMTQTMTSSQNTHQHRSETRDGMHIDFDVPIAMNDGVVLRADVFRPLKSGRYPVLLTYGPYAKGLAFQDGYPSAWERMVAQHPDVAAGSSNLYQNWEVVDPEKWVPHDYVCVRVDSRGCGCSPGFIDHFSPRETRDFHDCIAWAGVQDWSNGKVGLNGVSYYGINQWHVASLQPPHLAAMCIWEGAADWYRDMTHHGGILSTFWANWYDMQVKTVQYGAGERGRRSRVHGERVCGPDTLTESELQANRCDFGDTIRSHPLDDAYHKARSPDWSKVTVPFLSAANWGGQGLHPRGNFEGFVRAASKQKWLEAHGIEHWTHFYTDYGRELQLRFFDHFLHGKNNGWDKAPRVRLQVRHIDRFVERAESEWPLRRTRWTKFHLQPDGLLAPKGSAKTNKVTFDAMGDGVTFLTAPLERETEITGPSALKLFVSSSTRDADIFAILRVFSPDLKEVVFQGAIDPHTPIAQGWLRASHRKLDRKLSKPWRPYHSHDEKQPLKRDEVVELDIEIWPTCIVVPKGYRVALTIRGKDYEYGGASGGRLSNFKNELKGCGPFLHDDPLDRPAKIFAGATTLHWRRGRQPYLLLPIIPPRSNSSSKSRQS